MVAVDWSSIIADRNSPIPLYYQLAEAVETLVSAGDLRPGDRLPGERELAESAGMSRMTARQAITWLAERGIVEVRHGVGTFVAQTKFTSDPLHLLGFTEQMMAIGGTVSSTVLAQDIQPASRSASLALGIDEGSPVVRIMRRRELNSVPMLIETSFFPHGLVLGIETHDLSHQSLYTLLERRFGIRLSHAQQTVEAIAANEFESHQLGLSFGAPMLLLQGTAMTSDGIAGEFFKAVYRGDRFRFALRGADSQAGSLPAHAALPIDLVLT